VLKAQTDLNVWLDGPNLLNQVTIDISTLRFRVTQAAVPVLLVGQRQVPQNGVVPAKFLLDELPSERVDTGATKCDPVESYRIEQSGDLDLRRWPGMLSLHYLLPKLSKLQGLSSSAEFRIIPGQKSGVLPRTHPSPKDASS